MLPDVRSTAISNLFRITSVLAVCLSGCLASQVGSDGSNFRQSLLDMYTDQAVDNLIRAYENRPFCQLAYRNLIVTDEDLAKANVSDQIQPTSNHSIARTTGALLTRMRTLSNQVLFGASLERDRTMQFLADPVTGQPDIYIYYQAFAQDPTLFFALDKEPEFPVHIKKQYGCKWYCVPAEASGVFLQLVLVTAFMRGTDKPPALHWDTTIANAAVHPTALHTYQFALSEAIPDDSGTLLIRKDACTELAFSVVKTGGLSSSTTIPMTKTIEFAQTKLPVSATTLAALNGRPAQFFSTHYGHPLPSPSPDRQRLDAAVRAFYERTMHAGGSPHDDSAMPPSSAIEVPPNAPPSLEEPAPIISSFGTDATGNRSFPPGG